MYSVVYIQVVLPWVLLYILGVYLHTGGGTCMAHTCHTYVVWGNNRVSARVLVIRSRPLSCQQECTTFRYPQLVITSILAAWASSMVTYIDVLAQYPALEAVVNVLGACA